MTFNQAIKQINESAVQHLAPAKDGKSYVCPICNSGTNGRHGTGITTRDGIHFTCWVGCYKSASYIDILAIKSGIDPNNSLEAVKNACNLMGITLDNNKNASSKSRAKICKKPSEIQDNFDYQKFFDECHRNVDKPTCKAYLERRHLTEKTINRFNLGFCEDWRPRNKDGILIEKAPPSDRLIIPFSTGYLARAIGDSIKAEYQKQKQGRMNFLNIDILEKCESPIFLVEGEIDALSIIETGEAEAISLGSLAMLDRFLEYAKQHRPKHPIIVALDNDKAENKNAGEKATEKLRERQDELAKDGITLFFPDVDKLYCGRKDANDALCNADFFDFVPMIESAVNEALEQEKRNFERKQELVDKDSASNALNGFDEFVESSRQKSFISTGFGNLDELLDGGLFSGLYIVGAISSLGKTTFCLQIADQLAMQGQDVLIFSLEMSKYELIAKSISRLTSDLDLKKSHTNNNAKTTRGILTGSRYNGYKSDEIDLINQAKAEYAKYASHIFIHEGMGDINIQYIRRIIDQFKEIKGYAPVVLIDYLQIIAPNSDNKFFTDKQNTDYNVMELKRISREHNTTVIGISSFNRDNYTAPVNMASFKESGAIEYSSDVLIGLQYKDMDGLKEREAKQEATKIFSGIAEKAKNREPIEIQVKVLKNRNGNKGQVDLLFYPMFNKFKEARQR